MKCIVLAGGTGDLMWPLSRRDYPKQFMKINKYRSMFQETIIRNLSLCDEFIITANRQHQFIVEGQMEAFQGLNYRCIFEEEGKGTALPILLSLLLCNSSELIYVLTCDHLIEGEDYIDSVIEAKNIAKKGNITLFATKSCEYHQNYDYIEIDDNHNGRFVGNAKDCFLNENIYNNSGLMVFAVGDMVNAIKNHSPELYCKAKDIIERKDISKREIYIEKADILSLDSISIENAVLKKCSDIKVLCPDFKWYDVSDFEVFEKYHNDDTNIIKNNCEGTTVINQDNEKLVIVDKIDDAVIVNTDNALYITNKKSDNGIKDIMNEYRDRYEDFFNHSLVTYRPWGYRRLLTQTENYMVKEAVIFPGKRMNMHKHINRSEHWSVVDGIATITIGNNKRDYHKGESVFVPENEKHTLSNCTNDNVTIIEVSIGNGIKEDDIIRLDNIDETKESNADAGIIKLEPVFKDYLWGGTKLREIYNKRCEYDNIAESWELAAHKEGSSIVASGKYKGRTFSDYLENAGKSVLGWKAENAAHFPILIKFIDAKEQLSVQIHPDDEYALHNEKQLGKNEMWYIMDCDDEAYVYLGLNKELRREEVKKRIENKEIQKDLNKVRVKQGDVIFVESGTIHAIGKGIMICEIQQNSNCTYRVYDYDRVDKYGKKRELSLDKAMQVLRTEARDDSISIGYEKEIHEGYSSQTLVRCKYFECTKYEVDDYMQLSIDEASFRSIIVIDGEGTISDGEELFSYNTLDSFFVPASKKSIGIRGKSVLLVTHI